MAREIPEVVRAAAGLAATVLDEARKLPETLPGLPVRAISVAMQHAMKVQQTYAGLVARGDELLTGLRGDSEPGLATFDEDLEPVTVTQPSNGFRDSAFDRVDDEVIEPAVAATEEAPSTEEVLDELAIDEAVPEVADTDPLGTGGAEDAPVTEDADAVETALLESETATESATGSDTDTTSDAAPAEVETPDVATTVDVLTPEGEVETVEAAVTDEGIAAVESPQDEAVDESGSPVAAATTEAPASSAPTTPPIDGYDSFSIAQLRGRLRGYALSTVTDLLAYEEATRSREPYLRMLRNRLEKLEEQAVENSPLAPRGQ